MDLTAANQWADVARVILLLVTFPLAFIACKFAWAAIRSGRAEQAWLAATFVLLLATTSVQVLGRFGQPLLGVTLIYVAALGCAGMAVWKMYTVYPEWTRARIAGERQQAADDLQAVRDEQDVLRADDRVSQEGERADSRAMYDANQTDESAAAYDDRVEVRDAEDANRVHSHELQDDERAEVRDAEDHENRP